MANLQITKGYADGQVLTKALLDTSFDDVSTWLNARDNASADWLNVSISATSAIPLSITSSAATTTVKINNTATDGDPKISFQLSGSEKVALYVDDSDSDYFKCDNAGGTVFQVLASSTKRIEFMNGSVTTPSRTFIGAVQTGPYLVGSNDYGIAVFGSGQIKVTDGTTEPIVDNDVSLGTASHKWSDVRSYLINGADYGFANGYILREWPCNAEDIYEKSDAWMRANANKGIQILNDNHDVIAIIMRDGTIRAKKFETVTEF